MRIAVLVKQVPAFEALELGPDGRLARDGLELELNPYCRRAVAKGVELARATGGTCTVFTLGPPAAEDALREAVAWGADTGVLVTDPALAGSDTLATARALAATLRREGEWDLVLVGRNSVDADTGQVGPEVAELLDVPFLAGVRELSIDGDVVEAHCEYDDGFVHASTTLPALLSCAERLCDPAKVGRAGRAAVDPSRLRRVSAGELGGGPWGEAGSPTRVGRVEVLHVDRDRRVFTGLVDEQVAAAVAMMRDRGVLTALGTSAERSARPTLRNWDRVHGSKWASKTAIAVLVEPDRRRTACELLGAAARLADEIAGRVVAIASAEDDPKVLSRQGADDVVIVSGVSVEEDIASAVARWAVRAQPWAIVGPGTMWGREVASRVAARLGAGLTGDAVDLTVEGGRLVGWKPAFGGALVAAITSTSPVQMATVRPGVLPVPAPRAAAPAVPVERIVAHGRGRVRVLDAGRDDELDALVTARVVVGVGTGVAPDEYADLQQLLDTLGAELGATRKVTDRGWLPRSRQIGITGRTIAPTLYVALGLSGKCNHTVGVRGAGFVLAVNTDPSAPIFDTCDVGLVANWRDVAPRLVEEISISGSATARPCRTRARRPSGAV